MRRQMPSPDTLVCRAKSQTELRQRYPRGLFCDICGRFILGWVGPNQERPYACVDCRRGLKTALACRVTASQGLDSGTPESVAQDPCIDAGLRNMLRDVEDGHDEPLVKHRRRGGR